MFRFFLVFAPIKTFNKKDAQTKTCLLQAFVKIFISIIILYIMFKIGNYVKFFLNYYFLFFYFFELKYFFNNINTGNLSN